MVTRPPTDAISEYHTPKSTCQDLSGLVFDGIRRCLLLPGKIIAVFDRSEFAIAIGVCIWKTLSGFILSKPTIIIGIRTRTEPSKPFLVDYSTLMLDRINGSN